MTFLLVLLVVLGCPYGLSLGFPEPVLLLPLLLAPLALGNIDVD